MMFSGLVKLRLDPLRRLAVVALATKFALAQLRNDGAGRRQALAIDLGCFVPELRTHNRFRAMEVNALDMHDQYAARQPVVNREALHQVGVDRDRGAAIDAQGFSDARDKEE